MTTHLLLPPYLIASALLLASLDASLAGEPPEKSPVTGAAVLPLESESKWRIEAGAQWRQLGKTRFQGRSQARISDLPAVKSKASGGGTRYRDGYVRPDSTNGPQTWNWGYQNAPQVSGNTLTFSGSSSEVIARTRANSYQMDDSDDLANAGFFLLLESPALLTWERLSLSAALGYSHVRDETRNEGISFRAVQQSVLRSRSIRDGYDVSSIAPVPTAPYSGSFNGPGPLISLTPTRSTGGGVRERVLAREIFASYLEQSLELQLHTISLGPRSSVEWGDFRFHSGLGLAAHVVPWTASSRETLQSSRGRSVKTWSTSESSIDLLLGLYADLGMEWRVTKRWSLNTAVRYDWSQSLEGRVGNTEFAVDLGGWTAMIGVGMRF